MLCARFSESLVSLQRSFTKQLNNPLDALTSAELSRVSGLSPTAVNQALETMAAWNMIDRNQGRWRISTKTSLKALAEYCGGLEDIAAQLRRYKIERIIWQQWLAERTLSHAPVLASADDAYPYCRFGGPPDHEQSLVDLLPMKAVS
jgi:hypothetical protein